MSLVPVIINNTFVLRHIESGECITYDRTGMRERIERWKQIHRDKDHRRNWIPTEEELISIEYLFNAAYPCLRPIAPLTITYEPW